MEGSRSDIRCVALIVSLALLASVGCSARPPQSSEKNWRPVRSMVFHTPEALQAMGEAGISPDQLAWYDHRRDELPGVASGPGRVLVRETTRTYSHDHFGSAQGRVHDSSFTHTYSRRIEEALR